MGNWMITPSIHNYRLSAYLGGELDFSFDGGSNGNVIVSGFKKTTFKLKGCLWASHDMQKMKECFQRLEFVPDEEELRPFSLYMNDYYRQQSSWQKKRQAQTNLPLLTKN